VQQVTDALPIDILSRLIELSFEPIMVWDWHSGIVAWNQGCEQLYAYTRAESLGRTSHQLLQTRFARPYAEIEQAIEQRIARGQIVLQSEPLEIGEIIEPAIEMVQSLLNEKLHELRVD
jgi:PAS domain-containing protein